MKQDCKNISEKGKILKNCLFHFSGKRPESLYPLDLFRKGLEEFSNMENLILINFIISYVQPKQSAGITGISQCRQLHSYLLINQVFRLRLARFLSMWAASLPKMSQKRKVSRFSDSGKKKEILNLD